jgi:uncharacterized protein
MTATAERGYHPRRLEKEMPDWGEQLQVLRTQALVTIAMACDNEPYLVSMNMAFVEAERSFYTHCAPEGKKLDFLRSNPRVWGQVVEDGGPLPGKCTHKYRSVMFEGVVEFITDAPRKLRTLELLIDQFEPDPAATKTRMLKQGALDHTIVLGIRASRFSGKQSPPPAPL